MQLHQPVQEFERLMTGLVGPQMAELLPISTHWGPGLRELDLRTCINLREEALVDVCRRFAGLTRLVLSNCWSAISAT